MDASFVLLSAITPGSRNNSEKKTKITKFTLKRTLKKELLEPEVIDLTDETQPSVICLSSDDDSTYFDEMDTNSKKCDSNVSNDSSSTKISNDSGNDDNFKLILTDDSTTKNTQLSVDIDEFEQRRISSKIETILDKLNSSNEILVSESESITGDVTENNLSVAESEEILVQETESLEKLSNQSVHSIPESTCAESTQEVLVKENQKSNTSIIIEESTRNSSLLTSDNTDPHLTLDHTFKNYTENKLLVTSDESNIEKFSDMKEKLLLTSDESESEIKNVDNLCISETESETNETGHENTDLFTTARTFPEEKVDVNQSKVVQKWIKDTNMATTPKSKRYSEFGSSGENVQSDEYQTPIDKPTENLLNKLYGDLWKNSVKTKIPQTESRLKPMKSKQIEMKNFPQTERKPSKSSQGEISTTQIDFKHFTQKVRPDFESTRTPISRPKRDPFIVNDTDSETELNNTPSFHNFISNTKPKFQLFSTKKSTPPILKKLQQICDPESDENVTPKMGKTSQMDDETNSLQLEKLRLSDESEKLRLSDDESLVNLQTATEKSTYEEKSMEKLQLSPESEKIQSYQVMEIHQPDDNFKTPNQKILNQTKTTQRRKLFSQRKFEDDNSLLHECNLEFPEVTRLTYSSMVAPEPVDKENQTYVDLVYELKKKKLDKAQKMREKYFEKKKKDESQSLLPITKLKKTRKLLPKISDKHSNTDSDDEYIPTPIRKKSTKTTCKRTPKFANKLLVSSDSETDLEEYRDQRKIKSKISSSTSDTDDDKDIQSISDSSDSLSDDDAYRRQPVAVKQTPDRKLSFLASLSDFISKTESDPEAQVYKLYFKDKKEELALRLFNLYNKEIFNEQIPTTTPIEWNSRMRGTAGFCYNKKTVRSNGVTERSCRIVLSSKVIDHPSRLRDTLVHEMCHAATWLVDYISDGHGPYWKAWAKRAMRRYPELPQIRRCHDYKINTKYTYKCVDCGYCIGRHSKSLDINRKRCGYCYGQFELLLNKKTKDGVVKTIATPKVPKTPSGFALFVKENYKTVKQESNNLKHGDVMKLLGQKFSSMKMADKETEK